MRVGAAHSFARSMLLLAALSAVAPTVAAQEPEPDESFAFREGPRFRHPNQWVRQPAAEEGVAMLLRDPRGGRLPGKVTISTHKMADAREAVARLKQIAGEWTAPVQWLEIGGWPALERRVLAPRPRRGPRSTVGWEPGEQIVRLTTAVAAGATVVRVEASLDPNDEAELAGEVYAIGRSARFLERGDPDAVRRTLDDLRAEPSPASSAPLSGGGAALSAVESTVTTEASAGAPVRAQQAAGAPASEISIAVSANGRNVVVATNDGASWVRSGDGGRTFGPPTRLNLGLFDTRGDPSVAAGRANRFYYALIGLPNATTRATTVALSTDSGQTFNFLSNAVTCPNQGMPGACDPDQEHIAVDQWNAGPPPTSGDQIYSTWRNFVNGAPQATIICSSDGGATWPTRRTVDTAGDWPRVTVAPDGRVFVVYEAGNNIQVQRYSSCANGLTQELTAPARVAAVTTLPCPIPGIDRCVGGMNTLAGFTLSVDLADTTSRHLFVAYANSTGGNETIVVTDSTDRGATWTRNVTVSGGGAARRYLPWSCTLGDTVHTGWFDRRNATAANNDLTDYFRNSARVDASNNLVPGTEVRLTPVSDPQCGPGGAANPWPAATSNVNDAESCSVQPQLAGLCPIPPGSPPGTPPAACDFSDCNDTCAIPAPGLPGACRMSGAPCTTDANCQNVLSACACVGACATDRGQPKYGDYNEVACAAGRVYAAWASATDLVGNPNPGGRIDAFVDTTVVCCVPQIQTPPAVNFPETRLGRTSTLPLRVCNTGQAVLTVSNVTSNNAQFSVSPTTASVPVGGCVDLNASFAPTAAGTQSGRLTVASNDTVVPTVAVNVSGVGRAWRPLRPVLECVEDGAPGEFIARFGYENEDDVDQSVAIGPGNGFSPAPELRGQPTTFVPGRQREVFQVSFDGTPLTWTLTGLDGAARTATASGSSILCPVTVPPTGRTFVKAFAFGATSFTRAVPNAPGNNYIKVVQNGANFTYSSSQRHGYTDTTEMDTTPNNRGVLDGGDEIYDQFIGVKRGPGVRVVYRIDLPNGRYRFVAAGGDAFYADHATTLRVRDGSTGGLHTLVQDHVLPARHFWRVGFDGLEPPAGDGTGAQPAFDPVIESPTIQVTRGFIEVVQEVGAGHDEGGDLCLFEIWRVSPSPDRMAKAFAFGADSFSRDSPNATGRRYTKIVQNGANFTYAAAAGHGYTDRAQIDATPNDRDILSGADEIYDQFIGVKGGSGLSAVFRVDLPNGLYRFVAAGGDAAYDNHSTTLRVRNGSDGAFASLVADQALADRQYWRVGFEGLNPPLGDGSGTQPILMPLVDSATLRVTKGFVEIHQQVGAGRENGGDLCLLEIWSVGP